MGCMQPAGLCSQFCLPKSKTRGPRYSMSCLCAAAIFKHWGFATSMGQGERALEPRLPSLPTHMPVLMWLYLVSLWNAVVFTKDAGIFAP